MRTIKAFALLTAAAAATLLACSSAPTEKADVANESDAIAFAKNWKILGSLDYGQTSASFNYSNPPKYRAFKFAGNKGDKLDVKVTSSNGGDAVAWVLDNDLHVVGHNDDANGSLDSEIKVTLPANASATHYVVVRDYDLWNARFTVELEGTPATPVWASCNVDADCKAVPANGCCHNGRNDAVNKNHVKDYTASFTCPQTNPICPLYIMLDTRVAECNNGTHTCEMVAIDDIACGAYALNSHSCPDGYDCNTPGPDRPGSCEQSDAGSKFCGGIANIQCPTGQICVNDPTDSCDPNKGGADCGGTCQTKPAGKFCGGIAGIQCPKGQSCVDD
ncbi:MAG: PPC domain-containing protein, partial [Polyangiaceae bacterium]